MLCGTSFLVTGLVYVFATVETAARTSHVGCGFLCDCRISENILVGEGQDFFKWEGFSAFTEDQP